MPAVPDIFERTSDALDRLEDVVLDGVSRLAKRVNIPSNDTSPPGLIEANLRDPWSGSAKYALGWVYFSVLLLIFTAVVRFYHLWTDRIRTALHEEEVKKSSKTSSPDTDYELSVLGTDKSTTKFFPRAGALPVPAESERQTSGSSLAWINNLIAFVRFVFYRPIPALRLRKGWTPIVWPSLGVLFVVLSATAFAMLYCFLPQPLYWQSIEYGAPPITVRSGMLAVAMLPWIVALSMKANVVSLLTGIGHERLNVLHRWGGYICLLLSLIHTIPFYIVSPLDQRGLAIYKSYFNNANFYIYGTGIAALVPLGFLCVHSLPWLRRRMYETFVTLHVPVSVVFVAMMFWHCHNYLTSWNYLFATVGIWLFSYITRLLYLNWTDPRKLSWLIGDEAAVTILPENAIKVTIPTQMRWRPGQYVYLRMPGISIFENHPFTVSSLCSEDFPSEYGEDHRDLVLVFRPFGGFTRKVLETAQERGPWHTYRAFIDGPYGGMRRRLESFDHVVLIAGGSGITAIVSQLLDLIKRMRDGKAITKTVQVVWALKRPDCMDWFKEELRICREFAPPDSVRCQFYLTAAKRPSRIEPATKPHTPTKPVSLFVHDKVNDAFQDIANKRYSGISQKRNSALYNHDENEAAATHSEKDGGGGINNSNLHRDNDDSITALPPTYMGPPHRPATNHHHLAPPSPLPPHLKPPTPTHSIHERRRSNNLSLDITAAVEGGANALGRSSTAAQSFDFGFPTTPTVFQKNLMRFAFLPAAVQTKDGWSTEYGRPDIPYMLRRWSKGFGKRTCVFVCGPPSMRLDVSRTVAELQKDVWSGGREELFLHAENYAI